MLLTFSYNFTGFDGNYDERMNEALRIFLISFFYDCNKLICKIKTTNEGARKLSRHCCKNLAVINPSSLLADNNVAFL